MSLTSFFTIVCFEIDVLVCIFISCSVFKDHVHLSSAHLYYQILPASSNVFFIFFLHFLIIIQNPFYIYRLSTFLKLLFLLNNKVVL